jgi:hypothetical protein
MTELRTIRVKHKACDAAMIRRVVARLERRRGIDAEQLQVLLYLASMAGKIDEAFREPAKDAA